MKADLERWQREADRYERINVQEGTKGGRDAPRWIPVGVLQRETLRSAMAARPVGSRNLIAPHETYAQVAIARDSELNVARAIWATGPTGSRTCAVPGSRRGPISHATPHQQRPTEAGGHSSLPVSVENAEHDRERSCVAAMEAADSGGGEGPSNRRKNPSAW